jgi:hypothetical protein
MTHALVGLLALFGPLQMVLRVILVVGGIVVGALASGILFSLIASIFFKQPAPRSMRRFVQVLGAVALGLAAWKMPFGLGGNGEGFGSGFGLGGEARTGTDTASGEASRAEEEKSSRSEADTLRIEMLGGQRVQSERFYLLEGENEPKTLAELRKAIQARQQQEKPPLKGIEIIVHEHSVAQSHPAVRDLERWARQKDLAVTLTSK